MPLSKKKLQAKLDNIETQIDHELKEINKSRMGQIDELNRLDYNKNKIKGRINELEENSGTFFDEEFIEKELKKARTALSKLDGEMKHKSQHMDKEFSEFKKKTQQLEGRRELYEELIDAMEEIPKPTKK